MMHNMAECLAKKRKKKTNLGNEGLKRGVYVVIVSKRMKTANLTCLTYPNGQRRDESLLMAIIIQSYRYLQVMVAKIT